MAARLLGVFVVCAAGCLAAEPRYTSPTSLIMVVADGLGAEHLEHVPQAVHDAGDGRMVTFDVAPYVAPGSVTPESASAASALSTGCSVPARWISQVPTLTSPKTMGEMFTKQGKPVGAVSTACVADATVAAMFVHAKERHIYTDIGSRMADAGLSVALGGLTHTTPRRGGECVIQNRRDTTHGAACTTGALIGEYGSPNRLFALECQYMPYAVDRVQSEKYPTLLEMTQRAVRDLTSAASGKGFFLMVSADRIDHAIHTGKPARLLGELAELDATIGYLRHAFAESDNTMVVFTSDHATMFNSTKHTNATVPGFIYAHGIGRRLSGINGTTVPQTGVRKLIFPTSRNACGASMSGYYVVHHRDYGWGMLIITAAVLVAVYAGIIAGVTHIGVPRARHSYRRSPP